MMRKLLLSLFIIGLITSPVFAARSVLTFTATSVGVNSVMVQATNVSRNFLLVMNDSVDIDAYCIVSGTAIINTGIRLNGNGGSILMTDKWPTGAVFCVATSANGRILSIEGTGP